ncbi:50S ribosomal protein L7/L12 [Patescibacteria group bacterium]|nr:50S ribosomal protein L7/L12 [Patescibacteria group bacterium]MBU0777203.1 50S ribosomal protein L7/L12 [Patescibacteria group bacterium]MBU0845898.1 50S ribosomal protein L7/L12 [Patescibacteria group bacterium]MBU0922925.1 50S ribosomal protein L7/L12 [Patescibacteria group bacterium]MBU1066342.1 50S ribosomal protein L7/L12 [Patescibacteria group bacterium]
MANDKKETKKDLPKAVEKLVDEVSKLTVVELSQLVDALQDKLGVSAMPVAAAPAGGATTEAEGATEDTAAGANQTVIITGAGENKIAVIKAIREIDQNLGLKEAKDMTENLPAEVLKDAKAEDATAAADKLKAAGATVELK